MKKYLIAIITLIALVGCEKEVTYNLPTFPGFAGSGSEAVWMVYNHNITDVTYITSYLAKQVPVLTQATFEANYVNARQKEVSPYSFKFFKIGGVATIPTGQKAWVTQTDLKWELADVALILSKNVGGTWVQIASGYPDESKLSLKLKRAFFGDTSVDKDKNVMEILYTKL